MRKWPLALRSSVDFWKDMYEKEAAQNKETAAERPVLDTGENEHRVGSPAALPRLRPLSQQEMSNALPATVHTGRLVWKTFGGDTGSDG